MTKNHLATFLLLALSMTLSSFVEARFSKMVHNVLKEENITATKTNRKFISSSSLYQKLHLDKYGLSEEALDYAIRGYNNLVNDGKVENSKYLTVVDFSQPSTQKRFYLIDLENEELDVNTYVAHGKNSGKQIAEYFSNKINSFKSSLGFYLTKYTYTGKRGYSLRLAGLESKFNSNALKRAIVIHGSDFVNESRAENGKLGRSEGCPAIPRDDAKTVINKVKGGSVLFIYHPSEQYIQQSPVLNDVM